jgi:lipopolysaccharide transport system ATP-binding protein
MNAIQIENVWKEYRLGVISHGTFARDLQSWWANVRGTDDPNSKIQPVLVGQKPQIEGDCFWALRDVCLEIRQGEILGLIGKNGAGKSTLLKLLSRVTAPTKGQIKIKGRIASLLEVGTGFHPELTGRENIFMNGAILGMSRQEISVKLDEIIDFSGVEEFIDTPVKRYSSGMYVRLAFAVAAHLEPEILVVDEVLAVGDAEFQKKCIGKMDDVAHAGRTVIFVSHNMAMIGKLCSSGAWMQDGGVKKIGSAQETIDAYLAETFTNMLGATFEAKPDSSKASQLLKLSLTDESGRITENYHCDQRVVLRMIYEVRRKIQGMYGYMQIMTGDQTAVLVSDSFDGGNNALDSLDCGTHRITIAIPPRTLAPGDYHVYLNFTSPEYQGGNIDSPGIVCRFHLDDPASKRGNRRGGFFSTLLDWNLDSSILANAKKMFDK